MGFVHLMFKYLWHKMLLVLFKYITENTKMKNIYVMIVNH